MSLKDYIADRSGALLLNLACICVLSIFLYMIGNGIGEVAIIILCWLVILFFYFLPDYRYRKKYYDELVSLTDTLEQKYLTAEIGKVPISKEGGIYFRIMKKAMKSMADEVSQAQRENEEYRDFIEKWIHEIKVPITGAKLICENHKTDQSRKILTQVEQIETDVERVLYYARMGSVEKDYMIKEIQLNSAVQNVLARNKQLLISNRILINTEPVSFSVYTDQKWIEFIINQVIINCVKYRKQDSPKIDIIVEQGAQGVSLTIRDNGIGIKESEQKRIFEKGFTGSNGRANRSSTGIGLYLSRELCRKLGIEISVASVSGEYTAVTIFFPKGDYLPRQ
ncbi:sensor histidine kinase [uncultured Robinsoniella sp.]|uniref:sensor histidine kinase n=1 Tax=uncultured Robinsoniella sp. TaxID=904190 RepID=UPI00374E3CBC